MSDYKPLNYQMLLGKSVILYGESGTGKSTIILDMLHNLKDIVPACYVISPSENSNKVFQGILPDLMIDSRGDMTSEKLRDKLGEVVKRQINIMADYNLANDPVIIDSLIEKLEEQSMLDGDYIKQSQIIKDQIEECQNNIEQVKNDKSLKLGNQSDQLIQQFQQSISKCKVKYQQLKKRTIHKYRNQIQAGSIGELTDNQLIASMNMNLNPNLIIILDDCAAILSQNIQKHKIFKDIFYNGRHHLITIVIAVQNDGSLLPDIRANAFFSFFCSPRMLLRFGEKGNADKNTTKVFAARMSENHAEKERVLYHKDKGECIQFVPQRRDKFRFGSNTLWEYCKYLEQCD